MPAVKCGGCAKFLTQAEAAKCGKCNAFYHRGCVMLPTTGHVTPSWRCPDCTKHVSRDNRADTPVRSQFNMVLMEGSKTDNTESGPLHISSENPSSLFTNISKEFRLFTEELRGEMRAVLEEFQQFRTAITEIKEYLKVHEVRINTLSTRVDDLEHKFDQKIISGSLEDTIMDLKHQLNERDQELLLNDIEISGVTEMKDESTLHLVKILGTKLSISIEDNDIVHVQRVGLTHRNRISAGNGDSDLQRPRNICVRFTRRSVRDSLLRAARVRRGLCTGDFQLTGPTRNVYLNERLTPSNRQLFYNARQAGALHKWKYIWTRQGKILARKEDGNKVQRIACNEDIARIFV